jgi:hypothetical protein
LADNRCLHVLARVFRSPALQRMVGFKNSDRIKQRPLPAQCKARLACLKDKVRPEPVKWTDQADVALRVLFKLMVSDENSDDNWTEVNRKDAVLVRLELLYTLSLFKKDAASLFDTFFFFTLFFTSREFSLLYTVLIYKLAFYHLFFPSSFR